MVVAQAGGDIQGSSAATTRLRATCANPACAASFRLDAASRDGPSARVCHRLLTKPFAGWRTDGGMVSGGGGPPAASCDEPSAGRPPPPHSHHLISLFSICRIAIHMQTTKNTTR
jgi:hypothetical protein